MSSDNDNPQGPPRSGTYWFTITNKTSTAVTVIKPDTTRIVIQPEKEWGPQFSNGVYNVVAPGTPDVTYFKVHYLADYDTGTISIEKGQLNGNFVLTTVMK